MNSPKMTVSPIPLALVQHLLDLLGYALAFHDHTTERLHFQRIKVPHSSVMKAIESGTNNPPEWVCICKPDCLCDGQDGHFYDRDYVVDLLNKINGHVGGKTGTNLLVLLAEEKETH